MGKPIIHHDGWFMEWTTIADGPSTYGMRREEFESYYRSEYGEAGMRDLPGRLERALANGTSEFNADSIEDTIACNRAGYRESFLPLPDLIRIYCVEQRSPVEGEGIVRPADDL